MVLAIGLIQKECDSIILEKTKWNRLLIKRKLLTECNSGHLKRLIRFYSKASNTVRDGKV